MKTEKPSRTAASRAKLGEHLVAYRRRLTHPHAGRVAGANPGAGAGRRRSPWVCPHLDAGSVRRAWRPSEDHRRDEHRFDHGGGVRFRNDRRRDARVLRRAVLRAGGIGQAPVRAGQRVVLGCVEPDDAVAGERRGLFGALLPASVPQDFAELRTPLKIVATDFHTQRAHVMDKGR